MTQTWEYLVVLLYVAENKLQGKITSHHHHCYLGDLDPYQQYFNTGTPQVCETPQAERRLGLGRV